MVETFHETQDPESGGVHVSVDVAHAGLLWSRDPDLTWEALSQLEGLLVTMADDLGGARVQCSWVSDVEPAACKVEPWAAEQQVSLVRSLALVLVGPVDATFRVPSHEHL